MIDQATQIAINSPIENYAKQMSDEAALASGIIARGNVEDAFLFGKYGEYLNLQRATETAKETIWRWTQPGNVGNDPSKIGPGNPTATHTWTPGDVATLTAKGSAIAQANIYFYMSLPMLAVMPKRVVDHRIHQIVDLSTWRAPEWQWQETRGGMIRNGALQFNLLTKKLRYFVYNDTWHDFLTQPPFPDFTKPVETWTEFALDAGGITHVAVTINGSRYALGVTNPAVAKAGAADKLTVATQIDPLKDGFCSLAITACDLRLV